MECGSHGVCSRGICQCEEGWVGPTCEERSCHSHCAEHGQCRDGKCECSPGWEGDHCTIGKSQHTFIKVNWDNRRSLREFKWVSGQALHNIIWSWRRGKRNISYKFLWTERFLLWGHCTDFFHHFCSHHLSVLYIFLLSSTLSYSNERWYIEIKCH